MRRRVTASVLPLLFMLLMRGACPARAEEAAETSANPPTQSVCAVLSFDIREGVTVGQARMVTDRFGAELSRTSGFQVMPRDKMAEILELQAFDRSDSCSATECAIEAGRILQVQHMFYGSVGRIGDLFTLNAYLVNVEKAAVEHVATEDVRGGLDRVVTEGAATLAAQFAPEARNEEDAPAEAEAAPADCNTIVISKPREGTLRMRYRGDPITCRLVKPAVLYLPRGRHPFTLSVPGHETIYGVLNVEVVTSETRLFRLGHVEQLELFPSEKLQGVWRGSPVSGQVQLSLPTGTIRPLSYLLSLNRID